MPPLRIVIYWIIVVAFLSPFLIGGGMLAWRSLGLLWGGLRVDAVIVDTQASSGSKGRTVYSPIVLYSCGGPDDIVGQSDYSSGGPYGLGQHVYVYCDPDAPERFIIDTFGEKYFGALFMSPALAILAIAATKSLRKRRRKRLRREWMPVDGLVVAVPSPDDEQYGEPLLAVRFTHPADGRLIEVSTEDLPGECPDDIRAGDKLIVYADPRDASRYWVNIERSK